MLAVDAAERPHLDQHNFATQVSEAERSIGIQPGIVCQLGSKPEVWEGSGFQYHSVRLRILLGRTSKKNKGEVSENEASHVSLLMPPF